jgi:3',5'-cyclic AMP phosphodiesterase CpdA
MSDPQFGMYANNENFIQETANFEFAIANATRLKPKFIVICGDLINKAADPAQLAEFHRISAKLDQGIDLHLVAGNHDVGNTPTEVSLQAYRRALGKDYYEFEYPGFEGIVLDSSLIQHPEGAPADAARQEDWLRAELARANQAHVPSVVIFQHIPFFIKSADEPDGYFNIPQPTRAKYLELLRSSGVRYVFAGHTHYAVGGDGPSLHIFTAGPVGKPLSGGASGFGLAHLHGAEVQYQYFDFGHIPNTLETAFTAPTKSAPH